jgi:hypothetical protein
LSLRKAPDVSEIGFGVGQQSRARANARVKFLVSLGTVCIDQVLLGLSEPEAAIAAAEPGEHFNFCAFDASKCLIDREADGAHFM